MPSNPDMYLKDGLNWDLIRALYLEKCSTEERISQLYSLSRQHHAITKAKPKPQPVREYPNAVPEAQINLMVKYYEIGNKVTWIATEMNISAATVRKHLESRGVYDPDRDRSRKKDS